MWLYRRYGCRKTQRCKAKVNYAEETDSLDGQSSDQEEAQTLPSAPLPKVEATVLQFATVSFLDVFYASIKTFLCCQLFCVSVLQEEETSTEAATSTSASVCSQESERTSDLQAKMPTLCLWSVFVPLAGYLCELCSRTFSHASELVKHKQLHENPVSCEVGENISTEQEEVPKHAPEPSFPCNMCDRSFTTNQSLKRHKLLHVKDGRRCPKCGQIFCQLHNHVLFMPLPKTEHNSTTEESLSQDTDLSSESSSDPSDSLEDAPLLEEPEQDPESSAAESEPLSETQNPLPPASHLQIPTEIPQPKLRKVPSRQVSSYSRDDYPTDYIQLHLPRRPQLPPSLQVFSPQRLTSAFLEVRRNYEYILNKPVNVATGQYTAYELENVL